MENAETPAPLDADTVSEIIGYEEANLPTQTNSAFFKYVDETTFQSNNHISRILEEETLSTYVFRNSDGTKTVYYLPENVKFVTDDGTIQEKDLTLVAKTGGYGVKRSDISYLLPTSASSGIRLEHGSKEVALFPQNQNAKAGKATVTGESVRYANYFGNGIHLVYTPLPSGLKEDIVLDSYTGMHSFTFLLNSNGMRLYNKDGQYYVATAADAEEKLFLSDVLVYDAKGEPCPGTLTVTTITMGQQYQLTVSADPDFLTDPDTVYPVTIDPSLTISDNQEAGAIEDASVYELMPTLNTGTWTYAHCGYYSSAYGVGRTAYRLAGLMNDTQWQTIDPSNIVEAKLYVREASGTAAAAVNLYALTNSAWTETGVTWTTLGGYDSTVLATASPTYNAWGVWDITGLAKAWKNGTRSIQAGFVLMNANESSNCKSFYTSEHSATASRPYFTITYNNAVVEVVKGKTITLNATGITGTVTWASLNNNIATVTPAGVVEGVCEGETRITASVDGVVQETFPVRVLLKDGVYWIGSAIKGLYMSADSNSISNGTAVELHSLYSGAPNNLLQMWKIKYCGNGIYSVRPMHKLDMALHAGMDWATLQTAGTDDASIAASFRWEIIARMDGYAFMDGDTVLTYPENAGNDTPLIMDLYSDDDPNDHWSLIEMSFPPSGIVFYDTINHSLCTSFTAHLALGETKTLAELGIIPSAYSPTSNSQAVMWVTNDHHAVLIDGFSGTIRTLNYGITEIEACINLASGWVTQSCTVVCYRETVELEAEYDNGYAIRHTEAYSRVSNCLAAVQEFYLENFLLYIHYSEPQLFTSYGDSCLNSNPMVICSHGTCANSTIEEQSDYHHKNITNILYRIEPPATDRGIKVAYIGHEICLADKSGCDRKPTDSNPVFGMAAMSQRACCIACPKAPNKELCTTIHEIGHFFGAPDHYDAGAAYSSEMLSAMLGKSFDQTCIYGELKDDEDVINNIIICEGCREMINETVTGSDNQ
ncbi:MAG: DNRLRE domain-containing protein [Oscillospiraceae bacterium]|nr:DNRLRE domain-containing protein [Oscillospiraceae bacterium]